MSGKLNNLIQLYLDTEMKILTELGKLKKGNGVCECSLPDGIAIIEYDETDEARIRQKCRRCGGEIDR